MDLKNIIYSTIDLINSELPKNKQIEKKVNAELWGDKGKMDSLTLVRFVIALEENLELKYKKNISLTNDQMLSQKESPFRNITALTKYISSILERQ